MKPIYKISIIYNIISTVVIAVLMFMLFNERNKTDILSVKQQDSIINIIYKNNDSLIQSIQKKDNSLTDIENKYEEKNNIILNESSDSDLLFFTNYLERFSLDKQKSTENN